MNKKIKAGMRNIQTTETTLTTQEEGIKPVFSNLILYVLLAIIIAVYAFIRFRMKDVPLERDEGSYAYICQLLLDGKIPYVDFYEMKLPALYYLYALIVKLTGASAGGLHIGMMLICLLTSVLVYYTTKNLFRHEAAIVGALAYSAFSLSFYFFGFTAQAEHLVNFQIILAYFFLSRAYLDDKWYWWLLAGLVFSNAVFTKQAGATFALGYLLIMAMAVKKNHDNDYLKNAMQPILYSAIGSMIVVGFWVCLMYAYGVLDEMIFWVMDFPKGYTQLFTWDTRKEIFYDNLSTIFSNYPLLWIIGFVGLIFGIIKSQTRLAAVFAVSLIISAIISVMPGYYFYPHYWLFFSIPIAFVASFGMSMLLDLIKNGKTTFLTISITIMSVIIIFASDLAKNKKYYFSNKVDKISKNAYGINPFVECKEIAEYLAKKSKKGDELVVMGSEPQINFYTGMRSPTRHFFMGFLTKGRIEEAEWTAEAKKDIETKKPRFFVHVTHPFSWAYVDGVKTDLFDWSMAHAREYYNLIGIADLKNTGTIYAWDDQVNNYPPANPGDMRIFVFERKKQ